MGWSGWFGRRVGPVGSAGGGSVGVRKVGPVMELGEVGLPNEFE